MIKSNRTRRAQLRDMRRNGLPATASARLVAAGISSETAHRFSSAFSRGVEPVALATRLEPRADGTIRETPVKLYDFARFAARLAAYRPKDKDAAAEFATAAAWLAA